MIKGTLTLRFEPLLPSWLFTTKAQGEFPARTYSFKLFAKIMVIYHNPKLKDTFGDQGVKAQKIVLTYPNAQESGNYRRGIEVKPMPWMCGKVLLNVLMFI